MISICVAHAAWSDERRASLRRMLVRNESGFGRIPMPVISSEKPEHASIWFTRILERKVADSLPSALLLLNDDVEIVPEIDQIAQALLDAHPEQEIFSLFNPYEESLQLAKDGRRFLRTWHVSGPGFLIRSPQKALAYFESLPKWFSENKNVNEDGWLTQWAFERRMPVWTTIPSLVQHDASVPSTLGFDHHRYRTSPIFFQRSASARSTIKEARFWQTIGMPPFIEAPLFPESYLAHMQDKIERFRNFKAPGSWCVFCLQKERAIKSNETGAGLCEGCIQQVSTFK